MSWIWSLLVCTFSTVTFIQAPSFLAFRAFTCSYASILMLSLYLLYGLLRHKSDHVSCQLNILQCLPAGWLYQQVWIEGTYWWIDQYRPNLATLNKICISKWFIDKSVETHGRRSLVGCSPWVCWESDTTEQLHFHFSLSCTGEGNGNPLQCSCLENPRDRGPWWAAVSGIAQSWTQLKWLSSSSSNKVRIHCRRMRITIQEIWPEALGS